MKWVICMVKPFKTQAVVEALTETGVENILVSEVRGYGRQKGHLELYRGNEYSIAFLPKTRFEFILEDRDVEKATRAVIDIAATGRIGDGKIFILDVPQDFLL